MNSFYLLRSKYQNILKTVNPLHLFASDLRHEHYVKWLSFVHQVYVVHKFLSRVLLNLSVTGESVIDESSSGLMNYSLAPSITI